MRSIGEIAAEFGFEEAALAAHLDQAELLHAAARDIKRHDDIHNFAKAVRELAERWHKLGSSTKWLLGDHGYAGLVDKDNAAGPLIHRLVSTTETAARDAEWLKGEVKTGPKKNFALIQFTDCIKEFWVERRDDRFGCSFKKGAPQNEASRFLVACAGLLTAGYTSTNCEQAMRKVNEGDRIGWRKRTTQSSDRELTTDEAHKALEKFLYGKRD